MLDCQKEIYESLKPMKDIKVHPTAKQHIEIKCAEHQKRVMNFKLEDLVYRKSCEQVIDEFCDGCEKLNCKAKENEEKAEASFDERMSKATEEFYAFRYKIANKVKEIATKYDLNYPTLLKAFIYCFGDIMADKLDEAEKIEIIENMAKRNSF